MSTKNFTFASKDKEYVSNYNKYYYENVTKTKLENKKIANLVLTFAEIDNIEEILKQNDNVCDFAQYIYDNFDGYMKDVHTLVKICFKKPNVYFDFSCKTKLMSAIIKFKKNNAGVEL